MAYFGVAYFDPFDIHHFRGRKRPLVHSYISRGIWLIVDAQEHWKMFTVDNRGVGYACCEILYRSLVWALSSPGPAFFLASRC